MRPFLPALSVLLLGASLLAPLVGRAAESRPPNVVVILTDDQGYADISFNPHHPKEVATPHLDALAREGVWFSQGYITGNVCSPTRAGLLTGRYQQRAGVYTAGEGGRGIAQSEKIFPRFLQPAGYITAAYGKWHLGLTLEQSPIGRGFDRWYGFLGRGGHDYFDLAQADPESGPMYRDGKEIKDTGYMTTRLTDEAVAFIQQHKAQPFYIHLAYNAVHAPAQAPAEDIARFKQQFPNLSTARATLMAMLYHLDLGVGRVVDTLKQAGVWENTLLFFLTDNGGSRAMGAVNTPLRGAKQQNYEGGIRTPFIVSWPAGFKGGRTIDIPVSSLDILPTALEAARVPLPTDRPLDGRSLLPLLAGTTSQHIDTFYWSEGGEVGGFAVRSGDWKLVQQRGQAKVELFNLARDPAETTDLAPQNAAKVGELTKLYEAWLDQMAAPMSGAPKRPGAQPAGGGKKSKAEKRKARDEERAKKQED
ncbi:MAG: sulfatase-like hydrolase/transferase [Opitutaceae bacterium]|nr:sulfatase-like hydrolase/transferase [Opitutaceae bacterium]